MSHKRFRKTSEVVKEKASNWEKIKQFEEELSKTKYNKRTQHHIGLVKAKIAILKEKEEKRQRGKAKIEGFTVRKTGDGTVIIVGFPSVGKSTLLNSMTNADSPVGSYDFTTLTCIPGLLEYNYAKIQILDVPGVVKGAASGRGRGTEVLACAQNADLVMILLEVLHPGHLNVLEKEIYDVALRINQRKPDVKITKKERGGINIGTTVKLTKTDKKTLMDIAKEFRINNADIVIREDITQDQFIDVIENNKKYIPGIIVVNKIDLISEKKLEEIKRAVKPDICISAEKQTGIDELKELIFKKLALMRVYCKEIGKKADLDVPLIIWKNATLRDMCLKLHKDFVDKFKFARMWGRSSKFPGQQIRSLEHKLDDGDIVEIHLF